MNNLLVARTEQEVDAYARALSVEDIIEREQDSGIPFGPFHRRWQLERAPERVTKLLEQAAKHRELVAINSVFAGAEQQLFPPANLHAPIATTTTETNLWDPALWALIPALTMRAGTTYRVRWGGVCGTTSTPTMSLTIRIGTNNSAPPTGTTLNAGPTVTLGTFTAQPFFGECVVGVRSIGVAASGATLTGNGFQVMPAAAAATVTPILVAGGAIPATVDHTVAQGIGVSIIWGTSNGSNTLTPQWMTFHSE